MASDSGGAATSRQNRANPGKEVQEENHLPNIQSAVDEAINTLLNGKKLLYYILIYVKLC